MAQGHSFSNPILLLTQRKGSRGERRGQARIRFDDRVVLWRRGETGIAGCSSAWGLNLSGGGIRIIHSDSLDVGEQVGVTFDGERAAFPGRVVWVEAREDGCIAGIAFTRN